jgi:hypothetical protein
MGLCRGVTGGRASQGTASFAAFGLLAHHARLDGGFVRAPDGQGFFVAALFQAQPNEAGRI